MKLNKKTFLILLLGISFVFVNCAYKQKQILHNEEFESVKKIAFENNQTFCVVLLDTTTTTSTIYKERLEHEEFEAVFNMINIRLPENNWYKQWLYSGSTPVTCIFSPSGKLVDIIPGASRKCFDRIEKVIKTNVMCEDLNYYNSFSLEKEKLIPLYNDIIECKVAVEAGNNIEAQVNNLLDSIQHPYAVYLKMLNSVNQKDSRMAESSARQLLSFNDIWELEIYSGIFPAAKTVIDPDYDPGMEASLDCESQIQLSDCETGVAMPFNIVITNSGSSTLEISEIRLDCSCVSLIGDSTYMIEPQKSEPVNFEFTANEDGEIEREIVIKSNGIIPVKRIKVYAN